MLPWASHCRRTRAGRAQDNCILIEQLYGVFLMNDWCELEKLFSTHAPSLVPLYWNPGTWVWERRIFFSLSRKSLTWERAVQVLISPLCPTSNAQIRSADHRSKPDCCSLAIAPISRAPGKTEQVANTSWEPWPKFLPVQEPCGFTSVQVPGLCPKAPLDKALCSPCDSTCGWGHTSHPHHFTSFSSF